MKNRLSLKDWLSYIGNLHDRVIDLGLDRVRDIAIELDLLHPAVTVILVGGTNGKGTTCCLLETILLTHGGVSVGVYSSPHLLSYTERVRINGIESLESDHIAALDVIEQVRCTRSLTYFEFVTLSCLYLLKHKNLDVVILEVGLGGRLDATNIVSPDISVVTNIAIDHIDVLGSNYMDIAREKFGIFRACKPAVVGDFDYPEILRGIVCDWYGAIPFIKNEDWWFRVKKNTWSWWNHDYKLDLLNIPKIPLENAAVALSVVSIFPFSISKQSINYALKTAELPGRFQIIGYNPTIILDVAHNPHAAFYLSHRLRMMNILGVFRIVVGMLKTKDIFGTLCEFCDLMPIWYFSSLDCSFGASSSQLACYFKNYNHIQEFTDVCDAFRKAVLEASCNDCILVFGSFYTVEPILRLVTQKSDYGE